MVSTPTKAYFWLKLALVLSIVWLFVFTLNSFRPERHLVIIGQHKFSLEVADDFAKREEGLSGRSKLGSCVGMLLVFDETARHGIWMADMNFDIDVIWLDEKNQVVHLESDISANSFPKRYYPDKPARYIIEVPAGTIEEQDLVIGQRIQMSSEQ